MPRSGLLLGNGKRRPRRWGVLRKAGLAAATSLLTLGSMVALGVAPAGATLQTFTLPTQTTNPIAPGGTTTYTPITVHDSAASVYVTLSYTSGLPSGATFSDSESCVLGNSSHNSIFTAAQVATTSGVAGGSYPFTITATSYTNSFFCSNQFGASTTATGTGTLVVGSPAASGSGTMTVLPTSVVTSTSGNNLGFTFTSPAGASFGAGSEVTLTVPSTATWTLPQTSNSGNPGYVTVTPGTCTPSAPTVASRVITVPMSCAAGTSFTLNYANATAQTATGTATFTTATARAPGGLSRR